jgi:large subunit ribosomal protein L7Ae
VKYGLNHIVASFEAKNAALVVIACDVDPIELVIFLSALCHKMGVPYVIVKGQLTWVPLFTRRPRLSLPSKRSQ